MTRLNEQAKREAAIIAEGIDGSLIGVIIKTSVFAVLVVGVLAWAFPMPFDDCDDAATQTRCGVKVVTDHKTGRQYLVTHDGGITPRLEAK